MDIVWEQSISIIKQIRLVPLETAYRILTGLFKVDLPNLNVVIRMDVMGYPKYVCTHWEMSNFFAALNSKTCAIDRNGQLIKQL